MVAGSFPGYRRLFGPETLAVGDRCVRSAAEYRTWQLAHVIIRGGQVWETKTKVPAYINAGRYVADCAYCHKGMLTRPDWAIACCGECGAFYNVGAVVFPDDLSAAVSVLLRRPDRDTQNWRNPNIGRPIQTVDDLEEENREVLKLC